MVDSNDFNFNDVICLVAHTKSKFFFFFWGGGGFLSHTGVVLFLWHLKGSYRFYGFYGFLGLSGKLLEQ